MDLKQQNLLFFTRTMHLGGTENVVLQLCEILAPRVNRIVVCSGGGVNVEKLRAMGIEHRQIPDIEGKSPATMLKVAAALLRVVREEKITVIHTHHRMAAFYVALLGLYRRCRFVNTSHNTFNNRRALTRFAYRHANLIACGEQVRRNLVETFGLPEARVTVIHNAVKPFEEEIAPDPLLARLRREGAFLVGNVGRLSEQKGMEYFIRAVPRILERRPEARFVIVGSGEDEAKLKALAHETGVEGVLSFMGYRADVQNLMSQMDLVVLSSLWEGLPLTPIEAFSVGRTVVATAVDGTREIVRDGVDGFLVPPRDPAEIAERVCRLAEQPGLRREMEANALRRYREAFSFETFAEAYAGYYEHLQG